MSQPPDPAAADSSKPQRGFGERLVDAGYISQTQLDLAQREKKRRGGLIGQVLVGLGFIPQEILSAFLAPESCTKGVNVKRRVVLKTGPQLASRGTATP